MSKQHTHIEQASYWYWSPELNRTELNWSTNNYNNNNNNKYQQQQSC